MKIKKIEKLCKDAGYIFLYDELGSCNEETGELEEPARQWMGDGYAVYPLDGMPYLAEREVCAIFDIDEKKRDKIVINHFENLPEYVSLADQMETDEPLEEIRFQMSLGDDELAETEFTEAEEDPDEGSFRAALVIATNEEQITVHVDEAATCWVWSEESGWRRGK